eukprot:gene3020-1284_t
MAAGSLGALSYGYSRNVFPNNNEVVWVVRTYNPKEPRTTAAVPVPRHKFLYPTPQNLPDVPKEWKLQVEPSIFSYSLRDCGQKNYPSSQATRCEEWSTLRQTLPSRGYHERGSAPRWGTAGVLIPPRAAREYSKRFPHINSPMTR